MGLGFCFLEVYWNMRNRRKVSELMTWDLLCVVYESYPVPSTVWTPPPPAGGGRWRPPVLSLKWLILLSYLVVIHSDCLTRSAASVPVVLASGRVIHRKNPQSLCGAPQVSPSAPHLCSVSPFAAVQAHGADALGAAGLHTTEALSKMPLPTVQLRVFIHSFIHSFIQQVLPGY